jgi:nitrous oxide reductase accessory protein NosL
MKKMAFCSFTIVGMLALLILAGGCTTTQTSPSAETPKMSTCPNCEMVLKEWAHTNHEFTNPEGSFRTCSIHCVADMCLKCGTQPKDVRVVQPEKMIPATTAVYVIGSKDPGTMTQVSKLAFESKEAAEKFMGEKGGKSASFADTLAAATQELPKAHNSDQPDEQGQDRRPYGPGPMSCVQHDPGKIP